MLVERLEEGVLELELELQLEVVGRLLLRLQGARRLCSWRARAAELLGRVELLCS